MRKFIGIVVMVVMLAAQAQSAFAGGHRGHDRDRGGRSGRDVAESLGWLALAATIVVVVDVVDHAIDSAPEPVRYRRSPEVVVIHEDDDYRDYRNYRTEAYEAGLRDGYRGVVDRRWERSRNSSDYLCGRHDGQEIYDREQRERRECEARMRERSTRYDERVYYSGGETSAYRDWVERKDITSNDDDEESSTRPPNRDDL